MSAPKQTITEQVHAVFLQHKDRYLSSAYVASQLTGISRDAASGAIWLLRGAGAVRRAKAEAIIPAMQLRCRTDRASWVYKYDGAYQSQRPGKTPVPKRTGPLFQPTPPPVILSDRLVDVARNVLQGYDEAELALELLEIAADAKKANV